MNTLTSQWFEIISQWNITFAQDRTWQRATRLAVGSLCSFGRRTLSRSISATGCDQQDWSADYKLFSRSDWSITSLFRPILKKSLEQVDEDIIAVAFDDTKLHKTGRKIETASWQRDPLSPPFHVNMIWGLRFLQASLLLPLYRTSETPPRAIPVQFTEVPAVKKPGRKASKEDLLNYRKAKKANNLSISFVGQLKLLRTEMDQQGFEKKILLAVVDGSFCNRTCLTADVARTHIIARTRKDAALYYRAQNNNRRFYGEKFTPEMIRQDESKPWMTTKIFHGGQWREIKFKEVNKIYWKKGTKRKEMRLIVIAPTPYRLSKSKKLYYRDPSYLLTTDTETDVALLIQKYFDRWQIEVNFREEKDLIGVGEAQVRSTKAVPRQPAFVVATYSALLLSSVIIYNDKRKDCLMPLPKWRQDAKRPSILDLITQLRREVSQESEANERFDFGFSCNRAALLAAA